MLARLAIDLAAADRKLERDRVVRLATNLRVDLLRTMPV